VPFPLLFGNPQDRSNRYPIETSDAVIDRRVVLRRSTSRRKRLVCIIANWIILAKEGGHTVATAYSHSRSESHRGDDPGAGWTSLTGASEIPHSSHTEKAPLLARIPDVAAKTRTASNLPAQSCSQDFRFDPPQTRSQGHRYYAAADALPSLEPLPSFESLPPLPTTATSKLKERSRSTPLNSRLLPEGNTFAIPSERIQERIPPILQFLVLFVLFTVAGTSALMIVQATNHETSVNAAATNVESSIAVPTAVTLAPSVTPTPPPQTAPTSAGPTNDVSRTRPGSPSWPSFPGATGSTSQANESVPSVATRTEARGTVLPALAPQATEGPAFASPPVSDQRTSPYPSTGMQHTMPQPLPPTSSAGKLPQVRTHDPPPAQARFSGSIGTVSPR